MHEHLSNLGIQDPSTIDNYTLRQEGDQDILKIYFKKPKGGFFAKSVKFKYPRQPKRVLIDSTNNEYQETLEINPSLKSVIKELDLVTQRANSANALNIKQKILDDLRHLEKVVQNKINEIERDLEKL